jgi:uncharacterized protein YggE
MNRTILVSAVAVMAVSILAFASGYWLKVVTTEEPRWVRQETIDMTGEAVTDTPVQFATIKARVTVRNPTNPATAKLESDVTVNALIVAAAGHGIQRQAIDGSQVYIGPHLEYIPEERKDKQSGYEALRSLAIRLNDLPKLDAVLTDLVRLPTVTIQGVAFGSDDAEEAYNRALNQAVAIARRRADQLAAAAGFRITCIKDVDDTGWSDFVKTMTQCSTGPTGDEKINEASSFTKNTITVTASVRVQFTVVPLTTDDKLK